MTRVVEISAEAVAGVRRDLAAVCVPVDEDWRELRSRARELGVATSAFDDVLTVRDRLGTHVLPVIDTHLERARALEDLRYGPIGGPIPVLDLEPAPFPQPFTQTPFGDGSTTLTWEPTRLGEIEADQQQAEEAHGIGEWFSDRWDDLSASVSDGVDWVADRAADAWDEVTEAGAAISDWWDRATADVGAWIDQNLDGVRDFIGRHVGVFRLLADALRVVGKILIITGAALTLVLGAVGGLVGFGAGTLLGGVGGVPAGLAGAGVGAAFGLKILGAGFTAYSLGDLLDVAADWGEGTIDGQELVQRGALELGIAVTSLIGIGVIGKIIQKGIKHLPASWRKRVDDWLDSFTRRDPSTDSEMRAPLRSGAASGPGWVRRPDIEPDAHYGQVRSDAGPLAPKNGVPPTIDPDIAELGAGVGNPWGINPSTGRPFTQAEWEARFSTNTGDVRWPPNRGAVPGTRIEFTDPEKFIATYGNRFDRIGDDGGAFLGIPPDTPFAQRSLPPDTMDDGLYRYAFTGKLPPGVTIEVSEIAPAFGQPGGGLQARFIRGGRAVRVRDLKLEGVLR